MLDSGRSEIGTIHPISGRFGKQMVSGLADMDGVAPIGHALFKSAILNGRCHG